MRLALNLLVTVLLMALLLFAVGLVGGVGTVELGLWLVLLVVALVVVARRSRRQASG